MVTQGPTAGNNTDLVHRVVFRHQPANNGVPSLVIGRVALFVLGHNHGFALGAHHDLVLGQLELLHTHGAHIGASGKQCRLIHQVGKVCTGEAGSTWSHPGPDRGE